MDSPGTGSAASSGYGSPEGSPVSISDYENDQVGYLDRIPADVYKPLGTNLYFMTLTAPGGLTVAHMARLHTYLLKGIPDGPSYYIGTIEGGDAGQHKHVHLLLWDSASRRTDSVSRSVRNFIYDNDDLNSLSSTARLVLTRQVSDFAGACRYIFKADHVQHLGIFKLPPGIEFDSLSEDCRRHHLAACAARKATAGDLFPAAGSTRTIPPSKVPDFLVSAAASLQVPVGDFNSFGSLVHRCFARGVRFDLSKLRSYRLAVEMITRDPTIESAKVLQHELEWRSSN